MAGFRAVKFYLWSFVFLLVRVTQDFSTVEDTSTSVDFWVVCLFRCVYVKYPCGKCYSEATWN